MRLGFDAARRYAFAALAGLVLGLPALGAQAQTAGVAGVASGATAATHAAPAGPNVAGAPAPAATDGVPVKPGADAGQGTPPGATAALPTYTVRPGQSLAGVAAEVLENAGREADDAAVRVTADALFHANPRAFIAGDRNRLRVGATLSVPETIGAATLSATPSAASSPSGAPSGTPAVAASTTRSAAPSPGASMAAATPATPHAASVPATRATEAGAAPAQAASTVQNAASLQQLLAQKSASLSALDQSGASAPAVNPGRPVGETVKPGVAPQPAATHSMLPYVLAIGAAVGVLGLALVAGQRKARRRTETAASPADPRGQAAPVAGEPSAVADSPARAAAARAMETGLVPRAASPAEMPEEDETPVPAGDNRPLPAMPESVRRTLESLDLTLPTYDDEPAPPMSAPAPVADTGPADPSPAPEGGVARVPVAEVAHDARMAAPPGTPEAALPNLESEMAGPVGHAAVAGLGAAQYGPLNLDFTPEAPQHSMAASEPSPAELALVARNKLELAAEYVTLGDIDGARLLITEVVESNDVATRAEAQRLLASLAPLS